MAVVQYTFTHKQYINNTMDTKQYIFSNSPAILPLDLEMGHKFTKTFNSEMQGNMWDVKAKIST